MTASTGGGQFLAWWPSGASPVTVTGYSVAGVAVSTVPVASDTAVPAPTHR